MKLIAHFNMLQQTATHLVFTHTHPVVLYEAGCNSTATATHCTKLQHTATHCNTLQHTATHCNTLQHTLVTHTHTAVSYDGLGAIALRLGELKAAQVCVGCQNVVCVAVCCSVLQCVAVCCSVLQCVALCFSVLQCVAVCCSVLQCVAVCLSALRKSYVFYSMVSYMYSHTLHICNSGSSRQLRFV